MRHLLIVAAIVLLAPAAARAQELWPVEITLEAGQKEFFLGENFLLKFGVKNISNGPVKASWGGDYRGGTRASRFLITAVDDRGSKAVDPEPVQMMMGGLGSSPEIAPGNTLWMDAAPLRYCLIDRPGTYTFTVGHDLGLLRALPAGTQPATGPEAVPHAKITLVIKMPDEATAEKIVDGLVTMKDPGMTALSTNKSNVSIIRDFSALRHPIYLKPLRKHAAAGAPVVDGIASIETPEATAALIELLNDPNAEAVTRNLWHLQKRLPPGQAFGGFEYFRSQDTTGRYEAIFKATWKPEFAAPLRQFAVGQLARLARREPAPHADAAARLLDRVGEAADLLPILSALDTALADNVQHAPPPPFITPPVNTDIMLRAGRTLISRGGTIDDRTRVSAIALEIQRISAEKEYRPKGWTELLADASHDTRPYLRAAALQAYFNIPEPLPENLPARIAGLLHDTDRNARMAAIQLAGKSKDAALADALMNLLRTSRDEGELYYGGNAAVALGANHRWLQVCADRLDEDGKWSVFIRQLIAPVDDLSGGGDFSSPPRENILRAKSVWQQFVAQHQEALALGKPISLSELTPDMAPYPASFSKKSGGNWPR